MALVAAGTARAAVVHHHGPSPGTLFARSLRLRLSDFGSGWSVQSPPPRRVPKLTCPAFDPSVKGVAPTGAAASPTFQAGSSGPFVSQSVYAFAGATQEATFWDRVLRPHLVRCVAQSLVAGSSASVRFRVTGKHPLALPTLAVAARGYRVTGTATTTDQTVNVYLDMIVLGRGRAVTQISFSNFQQPADRALELRLARTMARRLPSR